MPAMFDTNAIFGEDFSYFTRVRLDDVRNEAEADLVWSLLGLSAGESVLDLACGYGRIALPLAARGARVHGIDISQALIGEAKLASAALGLTGCLLEVGDVRSLTAHGFDTALSWWSSFGYNDDATERDVLRRIFDSLRPGGRFLLDVINSTFVTRLAYGSPQGYTQVQESGDNFLIERRNVSADGARLIGNRTYIRDGKIVRGDVSIRMFVANELSDWLREAGFRDVSLLSDDGAPFHCDSRSVVALAIA